MIKSKKAAIELSMTTIIVVVLSLALLTLGFVLVRNIMCSSINTITNVNELSDSQIRDLFGAQGGEIQCVGEKDVLPVYAGKTNYIKCIISASEVADYEFKIEINEVYSTIPKDTIKKWLVEGGKFDNIAPGDKKSKQVGVLRVPDNAPDGDISLDLIITKNNEDFETDTLNFKVSRTNLINSALC
jgi:hypothetical protein